MNVLSEGMVLLGLLDARSGGSALGKSTTLLLPDVLMIIVIGLGLVAFFMVWAIYVRKPRRRHRDHTVGRRVYTESERESAEAAEEEAAHHEHGRRRYKYRYKRRSHRGRNPTLSETGGLPGARSEDVHERT